MNRHMFLMMVLALAVVAGGCASQPLLQQVSAGESVRIPIIELALRGSGDANALHSQRTEIYVAHVSLDELDAWMTGSDARVAAQLEGRSVDEVETEWQDAGIRSVPELDGSHLDQNYEAPYVLEVPVNAMPTAPAPNALPTSTVVR